MATTILWAGGEDLDFSTVGPVAYDQTAAHFRAGYARGAVSVPTQSSPGVATCNIGNIVTFTAASTLWFHGELFMDARAATVTPGIAFTDASGIQRFQVNLTGASFLTLIKQDGAGLKTNLVTGGFEPTIGSLTTIDVFINMSSANGSFAIYQNKTALASFSGNTLTDNQTTLTGFLLGGLTGFANNNYWSEVIVAGGDTRSMSVCTLYPSGTGNTNSWVVNSASSLWQAVNPWVVNDIGNIAVSTTSQLAEYTTSTLISGAFSVQAIVSSVRALAGTSGIVQGFAHVVRTAATDYSSATQQLQTSMTDYQNVWPSNPSTGANWQQADLTQQTFNIGVVSET